MWLSFDLCALLIAAFLFPEVYPSPLCVVFAPFFPLINFSNKIQRTKKYVRGKTKILLLSASKKGHQEENQRQQKAARQHCNLKMRLLFAVTCGLKIYRVNVRY